MQRENPNYMRKCSTRIGPPQYPIAAHLILMTRPILNRDFALILMDPATTELLSKFIVKWIRMSVDENVGSFNSFICKCHLIRHRINRKI
jgi:hypothetical protein